MLTLAGQTFASRVAGSLLRTVGLPGLITTSLEDYQAMALRLARDREQLARLRARLEANRKTCGLFDGEHFARGLQKAYAAMWEIHASVRTAAGVCGKRDLIPTTECSLARIQGPVPPAPCCGLSLKSPVSPSRMTKCFSRFQITRSIGIASSSPETPRIFPQRISVNSETAGGISTARFITIGISTLDSNPCTTT